MITLEFTQETNTYANTVNTRIPTRMKHNIIRYYNLTVKVTAIVRRAEETKPFPIQNTALKLIKKDTIHNSQETFFNAPRKPIRDLKNRP